jgi:peptide/nickel transport system ATP-binding protein
MTVVPAAVPDSGGAPAATPNADTVLLRTAGLTRHFRLGGLLSRRTLHAVDDLDMVIHEREIVALVGESGSGKTTVARLLAMIYPPTRGDIFYRGRSVHKLRSRRDVLWYRGEVPMVFQDPYSAMNPVFRVSHGVMRNLKLHRRDLSKAQRVEEAERVFDIVGLNPARDMLRKFPYEMSGGQRQRVGFAQALAVRPKLILADEPVSMLDVSIRAGILNMMANLRAQEDASILYITHDIASARYVADRIVVMYAGHAVEQGPTEVVLSRPKHPYTQLLLSAVPDPREKAVPVSADSGEPPRVIDPDEGCRFRQRCPYAIDKCAQITPLLRPMGPAHDAACHVALADADDGDAVSAGAPLVS